MASDLTRLTPPNFSEKEKHAVFQHFFHRLAAYRNTAELYASTEHILSSFPEDKKLETKDSFTHEVDQWAQGLLKNAWAACQEPGGGTVHVPCSLFTIHVSNIISSGECPELDPYADTSTGNLPTLPSPDNISKFLNTVLFLHVTTSKQYSARTRPFLSSFGAVDEQAIVATLKNPEEAIKEAERKTKATTDDHAERGKALRWAGMGLGAVAGGVLVGVTGGLAAPLVGAGVTSIFGFLGLGGSVVGLVASGLAGSSVVCGALFGAYGAKSTANMVSRHTKEIQDLAIVPVHKPTDLETMAVRLCVSGWLSTPEDVVQPWTVFGGDDTFALQWVKLLFPVYLLS